MRRRGFIGAVLAAPAIIRTPGLLMPVKPIAFDVSRFDELMTRLIEKDYPDLRYKTVNELGTVMGLIPHRPFLWKFLK